MLLLGSAAGLALAQPASQPVSYPECTKKPSPDDVEGAKGAHKAATQFFDQGNYDRAIQYWRDAYGFDCTAHGELLNIANAYEKKGDKAAAIVTLETYLKRAPSAPNAATIAQKIANLKASLAATPPPPPSTTVVLPPPSAMAPLPLPPPSATASASAAPTAAPTALPPAVGPRPYGYYPLITAGGGAALALLPGVIPLVVGMGNISAADKLCPQQGSIRACGKGTNASNAITEGNTGRTEEGVGIGFLVGGGAILVGGVIWQLAFNAPGPERPKDEAKNGLTLRPLVGPGSVGVAGSF